MSSTSPSNEHLFELLAKQVECELDPERQQDIVERVANDEEAQHQYVLFMMTQAMFERRMRRSGSAHRLQAVINSKVEQRILPECLPATTGPLRRAWQLLARPTPLSMTVATLAMVALVTLMAFMAPPFYRAMVRHGDGVPAENSYDIVAEVTGVHDAAWAPGQLSAFKGAHITAGRELKLDSGLAELMFRSGSRVVLQGPAVFRVVSSSAGELDIGKLAVQMPDGKQGFVVRTPTASVVDLGTEFGVQVADDGHTRVHVIAGSVEIHSTKLDQNQVLRVGEIATVDPVGAIESSPSAEFDFVRELPPLRWTELTFSIREPVPRNGTPIPPAYGDRVAASGSRDEAHTFYYKGGGDFTPDVTVEYSAGNSGKYLTWFTEDWDGGVGFLRSDGRAENRRPYYDTILTPHNGAEVRVVSFVLDDWDGDGEGHTVNWEIYLDAVAPENVIAKGQSVHLTDSQELIVRTGMTSAHSGQVILRIEHSAGKGNHLAIDNIRFEQCEVSPAPHL